MPSNNQPPIQHYPQQTTPSPGIPAAPLPEFPCFTDGNGLKYYIIPGLPEFPCANGARYHVIPASAFSGVPRPSGSLEEYGPAYSLSNPGGVDSPTPSMSQPLQSKPHSARAATYSAPVPTGAPGPVPQVTSDTQTMLARGHPTAPTDRQYNQGEAIAPPSSVPGPASADQLPYFNHVGSPTLPAVQRLQSSTRPHGARAATSSAPVPTGAPGQVLTSATQTMPAPGPPTAPTDPYSQRGAIARPSSVHGLAPADPPPYSHDEGSPAPPAAATSSAPMPMRAPGQVPQVTSDTQTMLARGHPTAPTDHQYSQGEAITPPSSVPGPPTETMSAAPAASEIMAPFTASPSATHEALIQSQVAQNAQTSGTRGSPDMDKPPIQAPQVFENGRLVGGSNDIKTPSHRAWFRSRTASFFV